MKTPIKDFIIMKGHFLLLSALNNGSRERDMAYVARKTKKSYANIVKLINAFQERGLIQSKIEGRRRLCSLTEKGEKVTKLLHRILKELEQ